MDESVVKHFEHQQVGSLKLSAAIRIGARLRPQGFGNYCAAGATCAVGAALESAGLLTVDYRFRTFCQHFGTSDALHDEIVYRNDKFRQTREQIADWLEGQGY